MASKTNATIQSSASNAAGGTTTGTGIDLRQSTDAAVTAKITNGATGPTVACNAICQISPDNSTWYEWARGTGGLANNGVYVYGWRVPRAFAYARVQFSGNTGQAVTVEAQCHYVVGT